MGRTKKNMDMPKEGALVAEKKVEVKYTESQICNLFRLTDTLRDVVLKKFQGASLSIDNWRKELTKHRVNYPPTP